MRRASSYAGRRSRRLVCVLVVISVLALAFIFTASTLANEKSSVERASSAQGTEYPVAVALTGNGKGTVQSLPAGIACPEDCSQEYPFKTPLTLLATPAPGSELDHWSIAACGSSTSCSTTVRGARTINAVFVAVGTRTLTVAKAGAGQGTVASKPAGIECGATCAAELDASVKVVLTASASPGSKFTGWSGEGCSGVRNCRVAMNEARNVTATFERDSLQPAVPGRLKILSGKAKGNRAQLSVSCFGETPCDGTLTLTAKIRDARGQAKGLAIARLPYDLPAGTIQTLALTLNGKAIAQLRSDGHLPIRIAGPGVEGRTVRLRVKR